MKKSVLTGEVFTIDTDENRCALIFSMQLQDELHSKKMFFITANNYQLVYKNLERIKPYINDFDKLHSKTNYLFLKDSFIKLYNQYGHNSIKNELHNIIEESGADLFFMHRIDLFFENSLEDNFEDIILSFVNDVRYHHKRVIFSYNSKTTRGKIIDDILKDKRDIPYIIYEDKNSKDEDCYSTVENYNEFLKKNYSKIILLSEDKDLIKLHKRVFKEKKGIKFDCFSLLDIVNQKIDIDNNVDLIIYDDSMVSINNKIVMFLKSYAHFSKIYLISKNRYLRKVDFGDAKNIGVDYINSYDFDLFEHILKIEEMIGYDFYSHKFKQILKDNIDKVLDEDSFKSYIIKLVKNDIIFSLLSIPLSKIKLSKDQIKEMIRDKDTIYYDQESKTLAIVLINVYGNRAKNIIAKRFNIKKKYIKLYENLMRER